MAIRPALKTAFLAELGESADSAAFEAVVSDIPAEYAADAEVATAIKDRRTELLGPAGSLTDSEVIDRVLASDSLRTRFGLGADGQPVVPAAPAADAVVAPVAAIADGKLTVGDALTLMLDPSVTAIDAVATAVVVDKATLEAARTAAVTDERLESLREVAKTLGAKDSATMDFDKIVALIADKQADLADGTKVDEDAPTQGGLGALGDELLGGGGLDGLKDFFEGDDDFYLNRPGSR